MKAEARKQAARAVLELLRSERHEIECGDCGAKHFAKWQRCLVRSRKEWLAASQVECECGSTLYSYAGTATPVGVFVEFFAEKVGAEPVMRAERVFRSSMVSYAVPSTGKPPFLLRAAASPGGASI